MSEEQSKSAENAEKQEKELSQSDEMREFVKNAYILLVYCGSERKFLKKKLNLIFCIIGTLLLGIASSVFSTLTFKEYTTYLLMSNVWHLMCVVLLIKVSRATRFIEAQTFMQKTTFTTIQKRNGIVIPYQPKKRYRITLAIGIIGTVLNILLAFDPEFLPHLVFAIIYSVLAAGCAVLSFFVLNLSRSFFGGYYASAYTHRTAKGKGGKPMTVYAVTDKIVKKDVFNKHTS